MNILLTSVGRRSYLVKYFKEVVGKNKDVHVSNSSSVTPAFNVADYAVTTPLIDEEEYIPFLLSYCQKYKIQAIISLFDIDLPILSANKSIFAEHGITVMVSDEAVISICNDKLKTARFLVAHGIATPVSYVSLQEMKKAIKEKRAQYPVIIKPRWGMGSIGVFQADNERDLEVFYEKARQTIRNSYLNDASRKHLNKSILIQEKLNGQEYGLDVINDLEGNYQATIVKEKYVLRSGKMEAAITVNNPDLKALGEKLSQLLEHIGNLDVDVFVQNGKPYVLEMNARFGGGYPFSHVAGVNLPLAMIQWLKGQDVAKELFQEEFDVFSYKDIGLTILTNDKSEDK